MIQEDMHKKIVANCESVISWFEEKAQGLQFPFYASFDIRDSGQKIGPVDANIFPAGFNNICQQDKDASVEVARNYLDQHYPENSKHIGLITEEHTKNAYYWENVLAIKELLESAGREVTVALPREMQPLQITASSGRELKVFGSDFGGAKPGLIISNNDFSDAHEDWAKNITTPINPPRELGWHKRRKDDFFAQYNELAGEFAQVVGVDPFCVQVISESFEDFDINSDESRDALAEQTQKFLDKLAIDYKERGLDRKPFAFVKNNAGTYGLGVTKVESGDDIRNWNNKTRKKMKAVKGGGSITSMIIQEGIPTRFQEENSTAEPCIYVVGSHLVGGFLRTHNKKGENESLNSPGAVYKRLCMSDMEVDLEGCPMEAVYGWISRLGVLAIAREAKSAGVVLY